MAYPKELLDVANYEMRVFERVSQDTGKKLIAEIVRLRELLATPRSEMTHECISCHHVYTPSEGESEDCPVCGCKGVIDGQ